MGASSKKKGQQRKAAKKALSAATAEGSVSGGSGDGSNSNIAGGNSNQSKIVAKIRRGNNYATKRLTSGVSIEEGFSYEHSGVLSAVLDFFNRCEDDTFDGVMASVGGDLKPPSLWMYTLVRASHVEPSCKLLIVQNIGPLARCMCDDTERLLFKSNKHWRQVIVMFVNLVINVMENKADKTLEDEKIVDTMLQYDGMMRSIVQWGYWGEQRRPDIIKELKSEGFTSTMSILMSRRVIELLVLNIGMKGEGRNRLLEIGTTSIVNKDYDPNCMISYTADLVQLLKTSINEKYKHVFGMVQRLIVDVDCVDKGVIIEMIDWGTNCVLNYDVALKVGMLFMEMMHQGSTIEDKFPCDTRVAFAIREGLIEMCFGFINRFREHESFVNDKLPMRDVIRWILEGINSVALHKKTAKAINNKRSSIEEKLVRMEQNTNITSNTEHKEILDMVRCILDINGSYCCRCNKSLSKTEVMQCNGCHRIVYCSRACQRDDWLNGHSITCCSSPAIKTIGQFQGRVSPEEGPSNEMAAAKLKEIEINMNMIHLKLFLDNSETILSQASGLDIPLFDCVVAFDLRNPALKVKVMEYMESFNSEDGIIGFEKSRSKDNIMCVYYSNIYIGEVEEELAMQRFFHHEWLISKE